MLVILECPEGAAERGVGFGDLIVVFLQFGEFERSFAYFYQALVCASLIEIADFFATGEKKQNNEKGGTKQALCPKTSRWDCGVIPIILPHIPYCPIKNMVWQE